MQHEAQTLERVIAARGAVASARAESDVKGVGRAETALRAGLGQLFALAENYPDLKASESFQHLQERITGLENGIADRRELYNAAVNINNVRIELHNLNQYLDNLSIDIPDIEIAGGVAHLGSTNVQALCLGDLSTTYIERNTT